MAGFRTELIKVDIFGFNVDKPGINLNVIINAFINNSNFLGHAP